MSYGIVSKQQENVKVYTGVLGQPTDVRDCFLLSYTLLTPFYWAYFLVLKAQQ
jgi:hypothetical protein